MSEYLIPALAAIIVAIIEAIAAIDRKQAKKNQKASEIQERRRTEETRLSMKMMSATLQLAIVTANALTGSHNNGNVENAKTAAESAQAEYQSFLERVTAQEVAK